MQLVEDGLAVQALAPIERLQSGRHLLPQIGKAQST
jgi:hypothetical protein